MIEAAQKVKQAKIRLSVTAISGLGGRRLWKEHAKDTGLVLSQMKPDYIGLLTLMIEEDLPLADKIRSGEFELLNPYDILIETKEMLKYMDCPDCIFRSNHASNYVNLRGTLNQDKEAMINLLDEAIKRKCSFEIRVDEGILNIARIKERDNRNIMSLLSRSFYAEKLIT